LRGKPAECLKRGLLGSPGVRPQVEGAWQKLHAVKSDWKGVGIRQVKTVEESFAQLVDYLQDEEMGGDERGCEYSNQNPRLLEEEIEENLARRLR